MLKCLTVPRRDPRADNLLRAEQPVALDVAIERGQRDEGGKAKPRSCSALDLWFYHSMGWPRSSPEGLGTPPQGILPAWHSTSQKQIRLINSELNMMKSAQTEEDFFSRETEDCSAFTTGNY